MNNLKLFGFKGFRHVLSFCMAICMAAGVLPVDLSAEAAEGEVKQIFVSPESTGGDGSSANPLGSITKALEVAKNMRDSMASGTVEIVLKSGTYRIDKTIKINDVLSGNENVQVAIVGEPGGKAKLTNSVLLPNDKFEKVSDPEIAARIPASARSNVYSINLKSLGIQNYGDRGRFQKYPTTMVTMNDEKFVTAKWPNNSEELVGGIGRATLGDILVQDDASQTYSFVTDAEKSRLEQWNNAEDPTVFGNFEHGYTTSYMNFGGTDPETGAITISGQKLVFKNIGYWWIENLIEELDQPGEYYLDRKNGILYLYPNGDIKTAQIEYAAENSSGTGNKTIMEFENAVNFRLENLWFENYLGYAVNLPWTRNGKDIIIKNCRMINGELGVYSQIEGTRIEGCEIYNMMGTSITAYAGDRNTLTPGRIVVTNNHIHKSNQGMRLGWVLNTHGVDNVYSHNLIHDAPHAAIAYGGNGNTIEYNEIYDVLQDTNDAGTIYGGRTWSAYGNVLQYNYIHDVRYWNNKHSNVSIYLDDMISGITVRNNVVQRVVGQSLIGGGHDITFTNNIYIDGLDKTADAIIYDARGYGSHGQPYTSNPQDNVYTNSITEIAYDSEIWLEKYPQVAAALAEGANPLEPANSYVVGNIASNWSLIPYNQIANEAKRSGTVKNNHMTMKRLSYEYNDLGAIVFTKPEEFDEFEDSEWFDTSTIGLTGEGNYDIPENRQLYAEDAVNLVENAKDVTLVKYPEKVIEAVDLLKDSSKVQIREGGALTPSGANYIVNGQVGYKAEVFDNFVLRYKYRFAPETTSAQVYMRAVEPVGDCWSGNYSYNFWLKPESFESQRWNPANTMMAVSSDIVWRPAGEWNNIEFVCDTLENGNVSLYVNINGHTVSSTQDSNAMKVTAPGYIMFGASGGTIEIGKYDESLNTAKQTYLDQNKEIEEILNSNGGEENNEAEEPVIVQEPIKIVLNGKELSMDSKPYIKNGRTYVPVRAIFEELGATVEWNEESKGVTAFFNGNRMYMGLNENYAVLNGEKKLTDAPAEINNNRTMVGVRFVSEIFNCDVEWFEESRIVEIKTEDYLKPEEPEDNEETEVKASEKYNDKGNVLLYHNVPQLINYKNGQQIADGVLDSQPDIDSLIDYNKTEENYYLRQGLLNFKTKLRNQPDRRLNVVFLGGSITQHDGYRNHICDWLSEQFGSNRFNFINAGYGGTGSGFGKNRAGYDVIAHDPDLVFVEFAVNDSSQPAKIAMQDMESIVRQILNYNSAAQIVFVYTYTPGHDDGGAALGKWTPMAKVHDYVAAHYGIPSIFIGADAAKDIAEGKALGKEADRTEENESLPLYSQDGVHPNEAGSARYFDTLKPFLEDLLINTDAKLDGVKDGAQVPYLFKDSAGDRVNFALDKYIDGEGITAEDAAKYPAAYDGIKNVYTTANVGEGVTFEFTGTQAGIIVLSAPDSGQVDIYVDGNIVSTVSAWHPIFSNGSETPYAISTPVLENGKHTVSFKVSDKIYNKLEELRKVSPTQVGAYENIGDAVLNSTKIIFESGWINGTFE